MSKKNLISELYKETVQKVSSSPQEWKKFLSVACRNYKLRYDEQLLLYAQRPDAIAVLTYSDWSSRFNRNVKKYSKGIAVFDKNLNGSFIKYYFDICDTVETETSKPVPIWEMKPEYEKDVIASLERTFGTLDNKDSLSSAILSVAKNAAKDNLDRYIQDFHNIVGDSDLGYLSLEESTNLYVSLVTESIAYMIMVRLGVNTTAVFENNNFETIKDFNSTQTLNALGIATSDISKKVLSVIAHTVFLSQKKYKNENRTFAQINDRVYNENENQNISERIDDNGKNHLHNQQERNGLSGYSNAQSTDNQFRSIRTDEAEIFRRESPGIVLQPTDELQTERAFERGGTDSNRAAGTLNERSGDEGRRHGETESKRSDGVGSEDEQYSQPSSGNGVDASSLRLDYYDRRFEDKSLPFFGNSDTIREILATTPHLKATKDEIRAYFESETDEDKRTEFIKRIFNNDYTEVILSDERRVGYKSYQNVLHLWEGRYPDRTKQSFYDWGVITRHFEAMRLLGELQDNIKRLPSMDGQMSLIHDNEAEVKSSAFTFSQEIIDTILCKGGQVSGGKMRIYEQFQKSLSHKENIEFLKKEYGLGGSAPVIIGTDIDELHDGKGITISKGFGKDNPHIDLNWNAVEKRIGELIKMDRYLNPKEKERYPDWLEQQEVHRAEIAEERRKREILSTAPAEKEAEQPENVVYEYNLGDKVYIGSQEYEILSVDENYIKIFDTHFPIFQQEMERSEFDRKVHENPMNDHLKIKTVNLGVETEAASLSKDEQHSSLYQNYLIVKSDNPNHIVLHQVGDFFEAYNEDAEKIAEEFELTMTSRSISESQRVPMVGFPKHSLETYVTMITDRGHDVAISAIEGDERRTYSLVSMNKEDPIESKPIGQINYLHTDGRIRESIEYTSPYQFEKDIKEESQYGVPMEIVLYKDKDGTTIPQDFISKLDTPPQSVKIIGSPYLETAMDKAKQLIDEYCREEFERDEGADYTNISEVNVAYTTTEDDKHEIQANVNLADFCIETLVDGKVIRSEQYENLEDMIERGLKNLSFDDLVYLSDEELERVEKQSVHIVPTWEKPKKNKVQSFDLHPEIPISERHNFNLSIHEIKEVNKKERFHRNYAAIKVLKDCQSENRFATPDEQIILSKYVGWGGIPEAFDNGADAWHTEYAMLKNILTPEEYNSARESTLTAFYTPPTVIEAVYKAMEQMGFREGNILEPSCGIGYFIGMMPNSMSESKIYGVELDRISAGIAQQLYQKTSIAAQPFEEANLPDSFFDAVVGNVPFGDFKVPDKRYDKHKFLIHDYFFAKSLDKLRPGGVMALITSKGTMDKENPAVRKYIAQRADLLGAIRLPNDTFKGNAGTEVVSDILILQKRDRLIDIEPEWVHLGQDENGNVMNSYFLDHPEMILGEMKMVSGRFGPELTCLPYEGADLAEQLNEAISNIHGEISAYEVDDELTEEDNSIPADPTVRNFSYTVVDDTIYFRENSRMAPVDVSATAESRIKGMILIRDSVRTLIELQTEDYSDAEIKAEQERLNSLYDTFTKQYGLINSRANTSVFSQDSSFSLLCALEILNDEGNLERKADMFFKRTIKPHTPVTSVDTSSEALAVSMGEKACIDMDYMKQLSGKTEEEIYQDLKGVIFLNPMYGYGNSTEAKYLMADEYLSGNVREKLAWARRSAELYPDDYTINVEALERVQPKDLTASEISVRLGATWLPIEIVEQFIYEFLGTPKYAQWKIKLHFSEHTGEWNIENKSYDIDNVKAYNTYGTNRINAYKIIEETLNLKSVRIFDYVEDENGNKKPVLNKKETAIAQSKQDLIKQGFQDWIWSDPHRRECLTKLYNEKFNSIRPREYDGSHITFNGMNPEIELREHQRNAVAHILYGGNTLLAHAVGAGKTFEMIAAAMESKRLGLCTKSLFVVPNHITEQWAAEFLQLYPSANILVATKKDFETKNRKKFCGRIATGDYDAIIIGHSQFEKIPMSIERQRAILEQQLDEITMGIADLKKNRGDNFSVKQLERTKKSVKLKLDKLNDQSRKDDVVTFEELGVDRLFIDESHYYKNLFLYTKMRNVGGIAQTEAQKSSDLFMKCRYLDEITGGRGTVFATGTPISNSMVELYTIQRYLQYDLLVKNDLQHFDAWASTFGETVAAVELTPEGTGYRTKTRFAKFYNLPELMAMFKEVADIKTSDMLNLPVPKANFHNISVKPSEIQKQMVAELAERAEKVRNGMVEAYVDNMLKITNDGRKLALDQRLINELLPDYEGSKLNACVDNIYRIWNEGKDKYLAQLFFCDLSTPKGDDTFSVYTDIRNKLIERGVPESEVRFIHEADTEAKKLELFKKTRKGEVRVLMGSTQKMGAGTNVQNKLIALHDLDCPWRPSDLEQRLGRIVRQGNENLEVDIYRYVTEQTFDAYLYQLVEGKQKFASQIMTSKSPVRSCEDIDETALSYAEIKMLATGDPNIKEKMDLDIQLQKLRLLKSNFLSEKYKLEDKIIKFYPQEIARRTEMIVSLKSDIERVKQHPKPIDDTFVGMSVKGVFYSEKADAGNAILESCKAMTNPTPIQIGEYRGFQMELLFDTVSQEYKIRLKGELGYLVSLGTDNFGNITRLDNALEGLGKRLEMNIQELENIKEQFAVAKVDVEKPFSQEEELKAKTARLNELNALLNVNKREDEIADGVPDDEDKEMKSKRKEGRCI